MIIALLLCYAIVGPKKRGTMKRFLFVFLSLLQSAFAMNLSQLFPDEIDALAEEALGSVDSHCCFNNKFSEDICEPPTKKTKTTPKHPHWTDYYPPDRYYIRLQPTPLGTSITLWDKELFPRYINALLKQAGFLRPENVKN